MSKGILIKILHSKYETTETILPCPFCGGTAEENSEYDSDDNRPDGYKYFISCTSCEAKGEPFYAKAINEVHLNKKSIIEQRAQTQLAHKSAIVAWNRRSYLTT